MAGSTTFAKHRNIYKGNIGKCFKRQAKNKLAAAQTKIESSMLKITYLDRKTNIWVREKIQVIDVIEQVRRQKWSWAGHSRSAG